MPSNPKAWAQKFPPSLDAQLIQPFINKLYISLPGTQIIHYIIEFDLNMQITPAIFFFLDHQHDLFMSRKINQTNEKKMLNGTTTTDFILPFFGP